MRGACMAARVAGCARQQGPRWLRNQPPCRARSGAVRCGAALTGGLYFLEGAGRLARTPAPPSLAVPVGSLLPSPAAGTAGSLSIMTSARRRCVGTGSGGPPNAPARWAGPFAAG
jgi:hypothetical protein